MNINDDIMPTYITLYDSLATGSCVKSWLDLMTKKIDTQKHFRETTIASSSTLSETKIPITIVKAQMPSKPNQKSRTRDKEAVLVYVAITFLVCPTLSHYGMIIIENRLR